MWWWHKITHAKIESQLRERFERYGETLMALAIESGDATRIGSDLASLGQGNREQIIEWLQERRDIVTNREDRLETVEWAILVFVLLGVILDVVLVIQGLKNSN
jgi:hypothetical protein